MTSPQTFFVANFYLETEDNRDLATMVQERNMSSQSSKDEEVTLTTLLENCHKMSGLHLFMNGSVCLYANKEIIRARVYLFMPCL